LDSALSATEKLSLDPGENKMTDLLHKSIFFITSCGLFLFTFNVFPSEGVVVVPLGDDLFVIPVNPERDNKEILLDCLVIGDSMGAATHANDACDRSPGDHRELMECLELQLGVA
jgi:hypothetical protein